MALKIAGSNTDSESGLGHTASSPAGQSNGGGGRIGRGTVLVKGRFEIFMDGPLPEYDSPPAVAYKAVAKRDNRDLIALICDPKLPPRIDAIANFHRVNQNGIVRVVDWDVVDWPLENRRCPVVLLSHPKGKRVFADKNTVRRKMNDDDVVKGFLQTVVQTLHEIHQTGETHRALRPENLFFADENEEQVILGECFSAPASVMQPICCETLENVVASPSGRGPGESHHDMYALGVCLLALLSGEYPCKNLSDGEIISQKYSVGSYSTLIQHHRVSQSMTEVLRGLLNDDINERWSADDLGLWLNGRRLSPKQPILPGKASRAFNVGEHSYFSARELAFGYSQNWDFAAPTIIDGSLDGWLRRSLGDEPLTEAVTQAKAAGDSDRDRLVARTIIALDPAGPIRYRNLSASLSGLGTYIGVNCENQDARKDFAAVLNLSLAGFWIEQQFVTRNENLNAANKLEKNRATLIRAGLGYGLERVIYDLNESFPCRSITFERDYVPTLEHLIPALDRAAMEQGEKMQRLVDREIAAFVGANFRRAIGGELRDMDDADEATKIIGQIRLLGYVQDTVARDFKAVALCRAAARLSKPAVDRFSSRQLRKRAFAKLAKSVKSGQLLDLIEIIDNPRELELDRRAYTHATNEFTKSAAELISLHRDIRNIDRIAATFGGRISSGLSGILAAIIFGAVTLFKFF